MQAFTALGLPAFYVLLFPVVYWCVDARHGLRLAACVMGSIWLNEMVKVVLHQPRPFWLCDECTAIGADGSFGFPSGHAQHAVVVWGLIAVELRRRWAWWPMVALAPVLIGLSRVYLGVHFPTDVIGGWLMGALLLVLMLRVAPRVAAGASDRSLIAHAAGGVALGVTLLVGGLAVDGAGRDWLIPAEWLTAARNVVGPGFDPFRLDYAFFAAGMIPGMLAGAGLATRLSLGGVDGSVRQRLVRLPIGLAPLAVLWGVLRQALDGVSDGGTGYYITVWGVGALLGLWLTAGAPLLFAHLRLIRQPEAFP